MKASFFNALDTALNCSAVTRGMWDGETIKLNVDLLSCHSRNVGQGIRTRKEQENESIKAEKVTGNRGHCAGGI